jgi:GAF domain-containing protein
LAVKHLSRGRSEALAAFHEISSLIVSSLDLDETLLTIARAATHVLDADIGAIFLPDEEPGLVARRVFGARTGAWQGLRLNPDRGLNADALRSGRVSRIDDYLPIAKADRELASRAVVLAEPIHSAMAVPVRHAGVGGDAGWNRPRPRDDDDGEARTRRWDPDRIAGLLLAELANRRDGRGTAIDTVRLIPLGEPLPDGRRRLGVLGFFRQGNRAFGREERLVMDEFGKKVSISLHRAELLRLAESWRGRLETAIEVAADLSSEVIRWVLVRAVEAGRADRGVLLRIDGEDTVVEDFYDVSGDSDLIG